MPDSIFEEFSSVYKFINTVNTRPMNEVFKDKDMPDSQKTEYGDNDGDLWSGTRTYKDANDLIAKGWNTGVAEMKQALKVFKRNVIVTRNKQSKSICGYAPSVGDAIIGVPKSMIKTEKHKALKKQKVCRIVYMKSVAASVKASDLMQYGLTVLKMCMLLDLQNTKTRIDVLPIAVFTTGEHSVVAPIVTIKDYRQPFNLLKMAYPIAHVSFLRRHGFRYLETVCDLHDDGFRVAYGKPLHILKDRSKKDYDDAIEKITGKSENTIYIDMDDILRSDCNPYRLAELKGIGIINKK